MHRRDFLLNGSLGLAGALCIPQILAKSEIILGHNQKRYRINTRWSQADVSRYPVNDCHEMVQDQQGRLLLLTNETKNNVLIYDKNGKILDAWGTEYPGAHGLTLGNENGADVLFICDNKRHQVIKTTIDGRVLLVLDYARETGKYAKAEEYVPTETAIAPNGDIYVADGYGLDYIIQYDHQGRYIRHFGGRGDGPEHLLNAHGVCVDMRDTTNPCLIVCSRQQNAFKCYDLEPVTLSSVSLSTLVNIGSYILPAAEIQVWGGADPQHLVLLRKLRPEQPKTTGAPALRTTLHCTFSARSVSVLKIVAQPVAKLPVWHPGKGERAWVFVDEVFLE